jgi:hypothetical protein
LITPNILFYLPTAVEREIWVLKLYQQIVPDNRYFGGVIQKLYIPHCIYGEFHGHRTYGKVQGLIKPLGTMAERGKKENA